MHSTPQNSREVLHEINLMELSNEFSPIIAQMEGDNNWSFRIFSLEMGNHFESLFDSELEKKEMGSFLEDLQNCKVEDRDIHGCGKIELENSLGISRNASKEFESEEIFNILSGKSSAAAQQVSNQPPQFSKSSPQFFPHGDQQAKVSLAGKVLYNNGAVGKYQQGSTMEFSSQTSQQTLYRPVARKVENNMKKNNNTLEREKTVHINCSNILNANSMHKS